MSKYKLLTQNLHYGHTPQILDAPEPVWKFRKIKKYMLPLPGVEPPHLCRPVRIVRTF